VAEAAPLPALVEVTVTLLSHPPEVMPFTSTCTVQLPLSGTVPPAKLNLLSLAVAVTTPPLQVVAVSGVASPPCRRKVSVNAAPVMATRLELAMVMVSLLVPFTRRVGREPLVMVAQSSRSGSRLRWVHCCRTGSKSPLRCYWSSAAGRAFTSTVTVQVPPLMASVPPAKLAEPVPATA